MSSITSRMQFLIQVAHMRPEMWDFIVPMGPVFKSTAIKEYIMAGLLRDISYQIPDRDIAHQVKSAGAEMVKFASANLISGWEDGDDICPRWPWPFPHRFDNFGPQPEPWFSAESTELNPQPLPPHTMVSALKLLAQFTTLSNVAEQLKDLVTRLDYQKGSRS